MPRYSYISKTLNGDTKTGVLDAENEKELARVLRQEKSVLISAVLENKEKNKKGVSFSLPFFKGVPLAEKIMFTRSLGVMISAGVSLPRALKILTEQAKSKSFKRAIINIAEEITKGSSFFEALSSYPNIFSDLFLNMVKIGEESGTLEDVLKVLTLQMEKDYELRSRIKNAMVYPIVVLTAMIIIGVLMMIIVVPQLAKTFEDLGIELPLTTKLVIGFGTFLANWWFLLPILVLFLAILFQRIVKTKAGKSAFDAVILHLPVVSPIVRKTNSARTTRALSSLAAAGVPIVRSLEITAGTLGNVYYKKAIIDASEKLKKGIKLSEALNSYKNIYPSIVIHMAAVGEETGELVQMLQKLADFFEDEVSNSMKNLATLIEPILMLIVGAAVGFFAISIMQPIYGLVNAF